MLKKINFSRLFDRLQQQEDAATVYKIENKRMDNEIPVKYKRKMDIAI